MRSVDTMGGIPVFVSGAEFELIQQFDNQEFQPKSKFNEAELYILENLLAKGVLDRIKLDEEMGFVRSINRRLQRND